MRQELAILHWAWAMGWEGVTTPIMSRDRMDFELLALLGATLARHWCDM